MHPFNNASLGTCKGQSLFPSKLALQMGELDPPSNTWFLGQPESITKRHLDRFSRFCIGSWTVTDRQTDQHTTQLRLYYVVGYCDAALKTSHECFLYGNNMLIATLGFGLTLKSHKRQLKLIGLISFWATRCKTVRPMLPDWFVVCLSCLSVCPVCDVGVLWSNGWMDQDATLYEDRPRPRPHCVRWGPSFSHGKGYNIPPMGIAAPTFRPTLLWHGRPSQQLLSSCFFSVECTELPFRVLHVG